MHIKNNNDIYKFSPGRLEKGKMKRSKAGTGLKWSIAGGQYDCTDQTIEQECLQTQQ